MASVCDIVHMWEDSDNEATGGEANDENGHKLWEDSVETIMERFHMEQSHAARFCELLRAYREGKDTKEAKAAVDE